MPVLDVFIQKQKIKRVNSLQYLGITLDHKLNWNIHIDRLQSKLLKLINNLSIAAKATWGLGTEALYILYKGAILPSLTYAINIWHTGLDRQHNLGKLQRVQRLMAIKIIKGYRTISYDAACVLARIIPINIIANQFNNQFKLLKSHENIENIMTDKVGKPINYKDWLHPALFPIINVNNTNNAELEIYTDGSKDGINVGCSCVIFEHGSLKTTHK